MTDTATGELPNLNEILSTAESRLAEMRLVLPVNFRFSWRETPFTARIDEFGGNRRLRLICDLGPVPYTAENQGLRQVVMGLIGTSEFSGPTISPVHALLVKVTSEVLNFMDAPFAPARVLSKRNFVVSLD